jgi:hypothetical protein
VTVSAVAAGADGWALDDDGDGLAGGDVIGRPARIRGIQFIIFFVVLFIVVLIVVIRLG